MKHDVLLSIVVPTKNRPLYLKSFIDLYASFDKDLTELVIHDNSDEESDIPQYIRQYPEHNIFYFFKREPIPVIENSELAILHSRGKYVCFMGDDDLLSKYIVEVVKQMEKAGVEAAIFTKAIFNWPGLEYKVHHFPSLRIPTFSGKLRFLDSGKEYERLLAHGATELGCMPQLYHGVVERSLLDKIKDRTGTFFPGPSPDMAIAASLSTIVSKYVFIDAPFISSGKSPKSAAGLGAKHEHKGDLKAISFLPADIEEKWDKRLPFIWTGPTIYAQSAIEAIQAMGQAKDLDRFDFSYFYAYFNTFFKEYRAQSKASAANVRINRLRYCLGRLIVFRKQLIVFLKNKALLKFHFGGTLADHIPNCVAAQALIDAELEKKHLNSITISG